MASQLPSQTLRRPALLQNCTCKQQARAASLLHRPHRPYTFTQLITLSDGSTYTARTTSPAPIFRSTKDSRNHPLWQPSLDSLRNIEQDEAGRLRAFRARFGRGWDIDSGAADEGGKDGGGKDGGGKDGGGKDGGKEAGKEGQAEADVSLMDLISGGQYSKSGEGDLPAGRTRPAKKEVKRVKRRGFA